MRALTCSALCFCPKACLGPAGVQSGCPYGLDSRSVRGGSGRMVVRKALRSGKNRPGVSGKSAVWRTGLFRGIRVARPLSGTVSAGRRCRDYLYPGLRRPVPSQPVRSSPSSARYRSATASSFSAISGCCDSTLQRSPGSRRMSYSSFSSTRRGIISPGMPSSPGVP